VKFPLKLDHKPALTRTDLHAPVEQLVSGKLVYGADEFTRMIIQGAAAFFKLVEFLNDRDGYDDVVLFELINAGAVVKDYICVKKKDLFFSVLAAPGY
jgi:hypothetical protein